MQLKNSKPPRAIKPNFELTEIFARFFIFGASFGISKDTEPAPKKAEFIIREIIIARSFADAQVVSPGKAKVLVRTDEFDVAVLLLPLRRRVGLTSVVNDDDFNIRVRIR